MRADCENSSGRRYHVLRSNAEKTFDDLYRPADDDGCGRAYLDAIAADQAVIDSLLEKIAGNSNDSDIARFASDTLTAVKNHEDSVKQLASR